MTTKNENLPVPMPSEKTTTKKVKIIGTQQFVNVATGEIEEFQVTNIEERDFNFTKIWLTNFLLTLDIISNQKVKVATYIIDNLTKDNMFIGTNRALAANTGISYVTVNSTIKLLLEADFLRRVQSGVYIINPNIVFRGTHQNRLHILNSYKQLDKETPTPPTKEEKIKRLKESIAYIQKEIKRLEENDIIDAEVENQLSFTMDGEIVQKAKRVK